MKILIVSDSHGKWQIMEQLVAQEAPDMVFHLGDMISDAQKLSCACPDTPVEAVLGNCDAWSSRGDTERIVTCEGVRFLLTHGHGFQVKSTLSLLEKAGQGERVDAALFGHTHKAHLEQVRGGLWLVNPGTVGGVYEPASYAVAQVEDGKVSFEIKWL